MYVFQVCQAVNVAGLVLGGGAAIALVAYGIHTLAKALGGEKKEEEKKYYYWPVQSKRDGNAL